LRSGLNTGNIVSMVFGPRTLRRVAWVAVLAVVVGGVAAAVLLLPSRSPQRHEVVQGGPAQVVRVPKTVRLTAERTATINAILDRFVPAAVERRHPASAYELVTPAFRAGVTRAEWNDGNLPVFPFDARDGDYHGWTLGHNYANEISVDVLLHPSAKEQLGAIAFTAVFKRRHERWLIDAFVPTASFASEKKAPRILAQPDFTPYADGRGKARLSAQWLAVPAALLALIAVVPIVLIAANVRRGRRALRAYQASYR
jgi:hypothetical protein